MILKDLAGKHMLDAVDMGGRIERYGIDENCMVIRFRLDGVVYEVIEDPDDEYRSHMDEITIAENTDMKNVFQNIEVIGVYHSKKNEDGWSEECDVLELIDTQTGKSILTVGTENTDDFYPCFIGRFDPTTMAINQN